MWTEIKQRIINQVFFVGLLLSCSVFSLSGMTLPKKLKEIVKKIKEMPESELSRDILVTIIKSSLKNNKEEEEEEEEELEDGGFNSSSPCGMNEEIRPKKPKHKDLLGEDEVRKDWDVLNTQKFPLTKIKKYKPTALVNVLEEEIKKLHEEMKKNKQQQTTLKDEQSEQEASLKLTQESSSESKPEENDLLGELLIALGEMKEESKKSVQKNEQEVTLKEK